MELVMKYVAYFVSVAAAMAFLAPQVEAGNLTLMNCSPGVNGLEAISVSNCDQTPCILEKGKKYTILMTFKPKGDIKMLSYNTTASVYGLKIPIASGDACDNLVDNKKCPLQDGVVYSFQMEATIGKFVPTVPKVLFIGKFSDEHKNVQACGAITLSIR